MSKTHWKKNVNPAFLGAYSLMNGDDQPTEMTVTIREVKYEEFTGQEGKKEWGNVAYLVNQKPMILNRTNQKTLQKLFNSPYIEDWAGKTITLFVQQVKVGREWTDGLRIKTTLPSKPKLSDDKLAEAIKYISAGSTTIEAVKTKYDLSEAQIKAITDATTNVQN